MDSDAPPPIGRRRKGTGQVTIRDVAALAGVSAMTVSRALKDPLQVSEAVLQRVRQAVEATGYLPNLTAGALSSGHSTLIAAVVPTISTLAMHSMLESLGDTLEAGGYQLLLGQAGYDGHRLGRLLETILARRPAGIVLTGLVEDAAARTRLRTGGVPVVETWDLSDEPIDMLVGFSHADMAAEVAHLLYRRGCRRLALLGADDRRSFDRADAFVAAAARLGLPAPVVQSVPAPASVGSGRQGLVALLEHGCPDVDGIFCSSDLTAMGVLAEAQSRGIAVPQRLAVVGCGDLPFAADLQPALTTVRLDGAGIGDRAARLLMDRIEGRPVAQGRWNLGFGIVERASA